MSKDYFLFKGSKLVQIEYDYKNNKATLIIRDEDDIFKCRKVHFKLNEFCEEFLDFLKHMDNVKKWS